MSLLNSVIKRNKVQASNIVVQVTRFDLNEQGGMEQQVMHCTNVQTGEQMRVIMAPAKTEKQAAERVDIVKLATSQKFKTEQGGFVRLDGVRKQGNGLHAAPFVRRLTAGANDSEHHYLQVKARLRPPYSKTVTRYGQAQTQTAAILDIHAGEAQSLQISDSQSFKNALFNMLKVGVAEMKGLGADTVFIRDSAFVQDIWVSKRNIQQADGSWTKPNDAQLMKQISENENVKNICVALDNLQEPITLDFTVGQTHFITGKYAESAELDRQANMFFKGDFQMQNNQTGKLELQQNLSGYRDTIIGFQKKNDRWFVHSVSASFGDLLTLNGLEENQQIRKQQQQNAQQAPAAPQKPPQQAPAMGYQPPQQTPTNGFQQPAQPQGGYQQTSANYYQHPPQTQDGYQQPAQGGYQQAPANGFQQPAYQQMEPEPAANNEFDINGFQDHSADGLIDDAFASFDEYQQGQSDDQIPF